jgi:hypothetical protein
MPVPGLQWFGSVEGVKEERKLILADFLLVVGHLPISAWLPDNFLSDFGEIEVVGNHLKFDQVHRLVG